MPSIIKNKWNKSHPKESRKATDKWHLRIAVENRNHIVDYFSTHPCVDCGETDPVVLEFDHVRGNKTGNIGRSYRRWLLKRLKLEIEKCEVRCANCHRKVTSTRQNWYTYTRL